MNYYITSFSGNLDQAKYGKSFCKPCGCWSLLLLWFCYFPQVVLAQDTKTVYPHAVVWSKLHVNEYFNDRVGIGVDLIYRRSDVLGQGSPLKRGSRESIRLWGNYNFTPYHRLSISPIAFMNRTDYAGIEDDFLLPNNKEYRTTTQFVHDLHNLKGKITHTWRYRHEFRWQEVNGSGNYRFFQRFRLRYRLRYIFGKKTFYENHMGYIALSNELAVNMGKTVVHNTFNQNRLYAGLGVRFLQSARIELRYVNQFRGRNAPAEFDNAHGIMLALFIDQLSGLGKAASVVTEAMD